MTISTFRQVPLTREPTCTRAIDPGTSGSTLTPVDTSWPSRSSGPFLTSRGQAPHGWPMVHQSMATGLPIQRGCCSTSYFPLPHPVTHLGLLPASRAFPFSCSCCATLATLSSWSRPLFPSLIPCFYPTGPPATLWRGPTGFSSIRGPFCAPCTGRSLPALFCLGGLFPSGPVGGPSSWPRIRFPHYPCLFPTWSPAFFFPRSTRGPSSAPFAPTRSPVPSSLCAVRPQAVPCGFVLRFFFVVCPPLFSLCVSCLVDSCPCRVALFSFVFFYPPPCMDARQHCTGNRVTAPLGVRLRSPHPLGACPWAVPGQARWAPVPRVTLLSFLSSLSSPPRHLPLARPLTAALLLCVLSVALLHARAVSGALSRASLPPPCSRSCRPTLAASPGTSLGGFPCRSPPPASPLSAP